MQRTQINTWKYEPTRFTAQATSSHAQNTSYRPRAMASSRVRVDPERKQWSSVTPVIHKLANYTVPNNTCYNNLQSISAQRDTYSQHNVAAKHMQQQHITCGPAALPRAVNSNNTHVRLTYTFGYSRHKPDKMSSRLASGGHVTTTR